jgi:hypothetical protein
VAEVDISKSNKKLRIIAYGFDVLGFQLPVMPVSVGDGAELHYLSFQANGALDRDDGVIIPQGIFEDIDYRRSYVGGNYAEVQFNRALLQEREESRGQTFTN